MTGLGWALLLAGCGLADLGRGGVPCAADADCDNGLYCDGAEACDLELGICRLGEPPCEDGASCTDDRCDEDARRCETEVDPAACSVCAGEICDPGAEGADAETGCLPGEPPACDAEAPCAEARCEDPIGCVVDYASAETACDDEVECTVDDRCDGAGGCAGAPDDGACAVYKTCIDGVCDPDAGCVEQYAPVGAYCDSRDCTAGDWCDGAGGCVGGPEEATSGSSCDSDLLCSEAEQCSTYGGVSACTCWGDDGAQLWWEVVQVCNDNYSCPLHNSEIAIGGDLLIGSPEDLLRAEIPSGALTLVVRYPCGDDAAVWGWYQDGSLKQLSGSIIYVDADGSTEVARWSFYNGWISQFFPDTETCEGTRSMQLEVSKLERT